MAQTPIVTVAEQAVSEKEAINLIKWLNTPEFNLLVQILQSRVRASLAQGMQSALESTEGHPFKMAASDEHLARAGRIRDTINTLQAIKEETKFTVNKWS